MLLSFKNKYSFKEGGNLYFSQLAPAIERLLEAQSVIKNLGFRVLENIYPDGSSLGVRVFLPLRGTIVSTEVLAGL